jgi:phosphate transport system substrate-binding protein
VIASPALPSVARDDGRSGAVALCPDTKEDFDVKLQRYGRLAAVVIAGSLALTACGSDDNSGSSGSSGSTSSASAGNVSCGSGTLNGEGSTAQKNAMDVWISEYQDQCSGTTINYNATGSGAGVKQFNAGQVDWGGSDSALSAEKGEVAAAQTRCSGNPAWNLPMVVGPLAVAYNVQGADKIVLNGATTANIFLGKITKWNDPAIAALNSGATLPDTAIKVFFRSDESGTTDNFQKYLKAASDGAWTIEPSKKWGGPVGEGKQGSSGVQQAVKSTPGAVSYMEFSFAKDAALGVAEIDNGSGAVELTSDSTAKAVSEAQIVGTGNDLALKLNYGTDAPGAYPIILVTYEIVCSKGQAADVTKLLKGFLGYTASDEGQAAVSGDLGYGVLPTDLQAKVQAAVEAIA